MSQPLFQAFASPGRTKLTRPVVAERGLVYTGLPWRFYKFGCWQEELCFQSIQPAL